MREPKPWLMGPLSQLGYTVLLLTLAFDQAHKWWMLLIYRIQDKGRITVTPFLDLVYVKNTGVSYGMFLQDSQEGQWLLAGFAVLASLAMAVWLARGVTDKLVAASLGLALVALDVGILHALAPDIDGAAVAAGSDEIVEPEPRQLLGHGGLAQRQQLLELGHRTLALGQQTQQQQPVLVGERLQEIAGLARVVHEPRQLGRDLLIAFERIDDVVGEDTLDLHTIRLRFSTSNSAA